MQAPCKQCVRPVLGRHGMCRTGIETINAQL
jgi:hypothetical protein